MSQLLERRRFLVLADTLRHLSLQPASDVIPRPPLSPLPQFLVTSPGQRRPENPFARLSREGNVQGEQENFEFQSLSWATASNWAVVKREAVIRGRAAQREASTRQNCTWVICPPEGLPSQVFHTPLFNLASYFDLLANARGPRVPSLLLGNNVLYGEAVTSTQTQLTR
jgi:hypothetical protein